MRCSHSLLLLMAFQVFTDLEIQQSGGAYLDLQLVEQGVSTLFQLNLVNQQAVPAEIYNYLSKCPSYDNHTQFAVSQTCCLVLCSSQTANHCKSNQCCCLRLVTMSD